jgi:hypothetical protein
MKRHFLFTFLFFLVISYTSVAQDGTSITTSNNDVDITTVYEQVVIEGYGTPFIYKKLANAYYFKSDYEKAKKWFEKLFEHETLTDATLKHRYKQSLKALNISLTSNQYLSVVGSN